MSLVDQMIFHIVVIIIIIVKYKYMKFNTPEYLLLV